MWTRARLDVKETRKNGKYEKRVIEVCAEERDGMKEKGIENIFVKVSLREEKRRRERERIISRA